MAKTKSTYGRALGKTQISISLPQNLVSSIDKMADIENRNRSNFIATHLEKLTMEYQVAEPAVSLSNGK